MSVSAKALTSPIKTQTQTGLYDERRDILHLAPQRYASETGEPVSVYVTNPEIDTIAARPEGIEFRGLK